MASKIFLSLCFLIQISLLSTGQQANITLCKDFSKKMGNIESIIEQYFEQFNDAGDYKIIIKLKKDTTNLYLDTYTSMAGVGNLEPLIHYNLKGKNLYVFMADGVKWKKDTTFHLEKSEFALDDNPTWLISLCDSGIILKKRVRGYFSPPLPPKGKTGKFQIPKIVNQ